MTSEAAAFLVYARDPSEESLSDLNKAAVRSFSAISLLPYDYEKIGAERFAWTWRIKNAYGNYSSQRGSARVSPAPTLPCRIQNRSGWTGFIRYMICRVT